MPLQIHHPREFDGNGAPTGRFADFEAGDSFVVSHRLFLKTRRGASPADSDDFAPAPAISLEQRGYESGWC